MNYRYMVNIWGGAWNKDANPSIEKDLGIKPGYHYFKTEGDKDEFLKLLNNPVYKTQGLMAICKDGPLSFTRTVFIGVFIYKDKEFTLQYDFGYEFPEETALYMFTQGNYSCDCNRSVFIRDQFGEDAMPDLGCGGEIELIDHQFAYLKGAENVYYHD